MPFISQMPIRRRRLFPNSSRPLISKVDPDGSVHDEYREDPVLPSCENFRLSNILKAGVSLQEVNTKILGASSIDLSSLSVPPKTTPSETTPPKTTPPKTTPSETTPSETTTSVTASSQET